jgi:hypothetical protein
VVFELHDADPPGGHRVWDQWIYLKGCKSSDFQLTIGPQDSETVVSPITPVAAILGDSLAPGRYWVTARVIIRQLPSQEALVELGPVDLP